jgi:hypothetical protein
MNVNIDADLHPGQKVFYHYHRRYTKLSLKWQSVFVGPFTVVRLIDSHVVVIKRYNHNVPIVVRRDKFKNSAEHI